MTSHHSTHNSSFRRHVLHRVFTVLLSSCLFRDSQPRPSSRYLQASLHPHWDYCFHGPSVNLPSLSSLIGPLQPSLHPRWDNGFLTVHRIKKIRRSRSKPFFTLYTSKSSFTSELGIASRFKIMQESCTLAHGLCGCSALETR